MGYKKLSQQQLTSTVKGEDSIVGVYDGKLGLANVDTWLSKINGSFDVNIESDTETEYILNITIGNKTIVTPNLRSVSVNRFEIIDGHLIIIMSDDSTIDLGVISKEVPTYGVRRDIPSHSPELTRVGDAVGLVAEVAVGNETVRNDFDNIYPWCEIKRCTLADDGTVTSYFGDPNYTEDGSIGQVMVEIPVYWKAHYLNEGETQEYTFMCKEKLDSRYFVPKRFIGKDGKILDKIYIGAFKMTTSADKKAESRSGLAYYESISFENAQTYCKNRGQNWHQYDIWDYEVIKDLFTVEFATLDSQSIMSGNCNGRYNIPHYTVYSSDEMWSRDEDITILTEEVNSFVSETEEPLYQVGDEVYFETPDLDSATGELDIIENNGTVAGICRTIVYVQEVDLQWTNEDGVIEHHPGFEYIFDGESVTVTGEFIVMKSVGRNGLTNYIKAASGELNGEQFKRPLKYRNMEYIYCDEYEWIDGVFVQESKYYVCENSNEYSKEITDSYKVLSYLTPEKSGYISKMGFDKDYPYVCLPIESQGSSDTDFCDNYSKIGRASTSVYKVCSGGTSGLLGGLFQLYTNYPATSSVQSTARLSYSHYE